MAAYHHNYAPCYVHWFFLFTIHSQHIFLFYYCGFYWNDESLNIVLNQQFMIGIKNPKMSEKINLFDDVTQRKALLRKNKLKEKFWIHSTYKHIIMHLIYMQRQLYYKLLSWGSRKIKCTKYFTDHDISMIKMRVVTRSI